MTMKVETKAFFIERKHLSILDLVLHSIKMTRWMIYERNGKGCIGQPKKSSDVVLFLGSPESLPINLHADSIVALLTHVLWLSALNLICFSFVVALHYSLVPLKRNDDSNPSIGLMC